MMHPEDPAILSAPAINSHKAIPSPKNAPILRLSNELLERCFEPILGKDSDILRLTWSAYAAPQMIVGTRVGLLDNRRVNIPGTCRLFRDVGLDFYYNQNTFIFDTDAHLRQFLAKVNPEHIKRIQHIVLGSKLEIRFRSPQSSRSFKLKREYGVYSYAGLSHFINLKSVHLYIEIDMEYAIFGGPDVAKDKALLAGPPMLPHVLAIGTWPEDVLWPTHEITQNSLFRSHNMVFDGFSSREKAEKYSRR